MRKEQKEQEQGLQPGQGYSGATAAIERRKKRSCELRANEYEMKSTGSGQAA